MSNKVPHKAKASSGPGRSFSEKVMIVLSILIAISMVTSLFAGLFY
ncbi:MAG: hypothetical protein KDE51_13225 [Anaerolineales bacterium]|nr:hypothetical protein [Anaerolineales bacterium]